MPTNEDPTGTDGSVRLPDLETIRRFSIAVRSEHADVDDVIDALRQDLQRLLEATGRIKPGHGAATGGEAASGAKPTAARRPPAKRQAPRPSKSTARRGTGRTLRGR